MIYFVTFLIIIASRVLRTHLLFILFFGVPVLMALLLVWIWANDNQALDGLSATLYAIRAWLRVMVCAGAIQFLLLPLVASPLHLRDFVTKLKVPPDFGILISSSVLFIPEAQRRLKAVLDARKAQGFPTRGFKGLLNIPAALMPLVSTLLISAVERGEFWEHRQLVAKKPNISANSIKYNFSISIVIALTAMGLIYAVMQVSSA